MNEIKHYTIVTTRGLEKIQAKYQTDQTVNLTHMGFGGTGEYIAPNAAATVVPNQWAKVPLERHPDTGFIGGGATVSNKKEYKGHWLGSVGIYDEDDELILIAATPLVEISLDESVVASYPIDLYTVLDNASSVVVVTDTSMTYATHDELNTAIESVEKKIPLAASAEDVAEGLDGEVWVSPETLKPQLDDIKGAISETANLTHKTFKVVGDSSKFTLVAFPLSLGANDKIQIWREGTDSIGGTDPNWNDGDATYFGEMSLDIDASGTRNCLVNAYQSRLIIGGINTKHAIPKQAEVFLRASPNGATYHYRYLTRAINPDVVIMTSAVLPSAHRPYDKTGAVSINVYGSFHEGMDRVYSPKNKPTPDAIGALTEAEANTLYLKKAVETILYNDSRKLLQNNALLQLDASLYDEIRFHSQWTVNSEGQMPYLSVSTIPVVDILEAVTRSGINSLFDMKTATSGAFYAACSVIYVANSKSLQFQTSGKYYQHVGVFKVVGIKH